MVLAPKLGAFAQAYPDVVLDVTTTNEMRLDLVAGHFDAGIHLGEFIERDMIAVRVSADQRAAIVGAPAYFAAHPKPKSPRDLTKHRCLNFRHGADETYRWEFDKGKQSLAVAVEGPLVVDDVQLLIRAAVAGVGLTFLMEEQAARFSAAAPWFACSTTGASRSPATFCLSEPAAAARRAVGADRGTATGRCSPYMTDDISRSSCDASVNRSIHIARARRGAPSIECKRGREVPVSINLRLGDPRPSAPRYPMASAPATK